MTTTEHDRGHEKAEMVRLRLRLNTIADTNKLLKPSLALKPFRKGENDFVNDFVNTKVNEHEHKRSCKRS